MSKQALREALAERLKQAKQTRIKIRNAKPETGVKLSEGQAKELAYRIKKMLFKKLH